MVFVIEGEWEFGGSPAGEAQVVLLDRAGDAIKAVNTGTKLLSFLLIAGEPLDEPVARYGPFVMNTEDEIREAIADFRSGRMGTLEPV